jgi:hypothetical protein
MIEERRSGITRSEAVEIYKKCRAARVAVPSSVTTALRRLLSGTDELGNSFREESGRVDRKAFPRFATGDENIFSRRTRREGNDSAVSILLDLSASMSQKGIEHAQRVVIHLGSLLDSCRAQWACTGYYTLNVEYIMKNDEVESSLENVSFIEIKTFKQSTLQAAAELGSLQKLCYGKTPDFAAPILHLREIDALSVRKKVLILLTDATTLVPDQCKYVSDFADKLHINLVVIGINAGHRISAYGDAAVDVKNPEDLSKKAFSHLLKRVSDKHRICA